MKWRTLIFGLIALSFAASFLVRTSLCFRERFLLRFLDVSRWPLKAFDFLTFPLLVILMRLDTAFLVLILGMVFSF